MLQGKAANGGRQERSKLPYLACMATFTEGHNHAAEGQHPRIFLIFLILHALLVRDACFVLHFALTLAGACVWQQEACH